MTPKELRDVLRDSLVEMAWSQWTAVGVAGVGPSAQSALIDPEALLIASTSVARWDARLFDEVLDWVAVNGALIDPARLRRLAERADPVQRRLVLAILGSAARVSESDGLQRVEETLLAREDAACYGAEPLFHADGPHVPDWTPGDDVFSAFGFQRPVPTLRAMSARPEAPAPPCLRFALRALAGIGARAEVLTYLLTHEWAHGRLIAEHAAYNQSVVADYLVTLFEAGQVDRRTQGRRVEYRAAGLLRNTLAVAPTYVAWHQVWPALTVLLEAASDGGSDQAQWVRIADALDARRDALSSEGFEFDVPRLDGWARRGTRDIEAAVEGIAARCRALAR